MASHYLITLSDEESNLLSPLPVHSGTDITIQNVNSDGYIYIGANDTVTSSDYGYRLSPNCAISFELNGRDSLYAISSLPNLVIAVLRTGLESGS